MASTSQILHLRIQVTSSSRRAPGAPPFDHSVASHIQRSSHNHLSGLSEGAQNTGLNIVLMNRARTELTLCPGLNFIRNSKNAKTNPRDLERAHLPPGQSV